MIEAPPAQVPTTRRRGAGGGTGSRPSCRWSCSSCWRSCRTRTVYLPGLFDGPLNSPGTLQLLAICLVFGGLAAGYDLLFGRTGMLSFGHALYFAAGVYGTDILRHPGRLAAVAGRAADRRRRHHRSPRCSARWRCAPSGIAFAMVTLAFAQVGAILVARDSGRPDRRRGGAAAGRVRAAGRRWSA